MSLVDQKMKRASADLEAAFERIPPLHLPETVKTPPSTSERAGAAVLAIGIVAVVAVSLALMAPGGAPVSEETPPPSVTEPPPAEENEPPIVAEPEVATLTSTAVEVGVFQPILVGDQIFGVSSGIWLPNRDGGWDYSDYEVIGAPPKGWIREIDALGDLYVGIYRTVVDEGDEGSPVDILIYSDDALTWHPGEVADTREQPFWKMAAGDDFALATAARPDRLMEVWRSDDGREWTLATTIDETRMQGDELVHRDGRFYMTGLSEGHAEGTLLLGTSTDGITWQTISAPLSSPGSWVSTVETIHDTLVVLIAEGWREAVWAFSGGEWTDVTPSGFRGTLVEQADPSGPLFLADDFNHSVWWTFDGYNWSTEPINGGRFGLSGSYPAVSSGKTIVAMHTASSVSRGYWIGVLE